MSNETPRGQQPHPFPANTAGGATQTSDGPADGARTHPDRALWPHVDLASLAQQLSPGELQEIGEAAPLSGQKMMWDEVVRRYPTLAAEVRSGRPAGGSIYQIDPDRLIPWG